MIVVHLLVFIGSCAFRSVCKLLLGSPPPFGHTLRQLLRHWLVSCLTNSVSLSAVLVAGTSCYTCLNSYIFPVQKVVLFLTGVIVS